jgi:hypothetical protein
MSTTTPEILRKAAEVVRERGLNKGLYIAEKGDPATACVCTYGALYIAAGAEPHVIDGTEDLLLIGQEALSNTLRDEVYAASAALDTALAYRSDGAFVGVINWNDESTTTAEDVIALLESTATELEAAA